MDGMETPGTEPGTAGTDTMDGMAGMGLLSLKQLLNPPTGGMTHGEHGTTNGTAGTPDGAGIPFGEQDPQHGVMETGTGTTASTTESFPQLDQEFMFLKTLKYLRK